MECKCGSKIIIDDDNFRILNGNFIIVCNNCKRMYLESDFSEIEIEEAYWKTTS